MIVRKDHNGQTLLVGQTDHSRLAGQFAAHWGNEQFAPLEPYESVVRVAHFHDFGHLRYETSPIFNAETGETPSFREIPTDTKRLEEYQWCFDWFLAPDPYASFIANMHRTGLSRARYDSITHPESKLRNKGAEVDEFVTRNEAAREKYLATQNWDPQQIRMNYRLLQVWDLMSLYFSCQEPYEEYIEPVPTSYQDRDGEGVRMTLTPSGPNQITIDPFPFDVNPCRVQLAGRRLSAAKFADKDAFTRAYFQGSLEVLQFELVGPVTARETDRSRERLVTPAGV